MRLSDVLAADLAIVPLERDTVAAAADALLGRLVASGAVTDPDKLRGRVAEERPEDIVAMGDRAFLLHYRTDAVRELRVAIGTARHPICRDIAEGGRQCAQVVLLVVAPPRQATRYLQVVGGFARLLSRPGVIEELLAQGDAEGLVRVAAFAEYELSPQITVRELMTDRPRTVTPDTPLRDAARDMLRHRIRALPVVDGDGLVVGILGERELLQTLLSGYLQGGRGARPSGSLDVPPQTVRDAMTRQVLCVSPDQPLAEVASIMTNKDVDRVPVVREGRIVGLLTRGDIVRKLIGN